MDAAATATSLLTDPLSPELVLVSPPEVARRARLLLSPPPVARPVTVRAPYAGIVELAAVWLVCLAMTLGPVLLLVAASG
jgi:hypothetical protein